FVFFVSSRRRHTISYGDWSSDVCSSDLKAARVSPFLPAVATSASSSFSSRAVSDSPILRISAGGSSIPSRKRASFAHAAAPIGRSEERRGGKGGRSGRRRTISTPTDRAD